MFEVIKHYDGYRMNHPDFQHVYRTVYKKKIVTDFVDKGDDNVYLMVEDEDIELPVFYHCGKRVTLADEFSLIDGARAFYEFKDDDPPEVIVAYVDNEPVAIIAHAEHEPRFCCVEPYYYEPENFPWLTTRPCSLGYIKESDHAQITVVGDNTTAEAIVGYKKINNIMHFYADMHVSAKCPPPDHCGGGLSFQECLAESYAYDTIDVLAFGEKYGIPYRCDSVAILNFDTDLPIISYFRDALSEVKLIATSVGNAWGDKDEKEFNLLEDYTKNERIEIPLGGSKDKLIESLEFRANIWTSQAQDMWCPRRKEVKGFASIKYLCVDPSEETIKNMDDYKEDE
jgi:hypothetical protein